MSTRRARKHKGLVESEKMLHHLSGTHYSWPQKTRCVNLSRAEAAESAYEWRTLYVESAYEWRKHYSELAQNLYKFGPISVNSSLDPEFAQKLWEALNHD